MSSKQLRYYIALGAPPTRAPADVLETGLRPEVGFNPSWFRQFCQIDFSQHWHENPAYRLQAYEIMRAEVDRRFPDCRIGQSDSESPDLITGLYGTAIIPALFGQQIKYAPHMWPAPHGEPLTDAQADALSPVEVENHPIFSNILEQFDRVEQLTGNVRGFLNWQGPLNSAFRLRGEKIFLDLFDCPERVHHVLDCITTTMIRAIKRIHERQQKSGGGVSLFQCCELRGEYDRSGSLRRVHSAL